MTLKTTLNNVEVDTIIAALRSYQLDMTVLGAFDRLDAQIQDLATNDNQHPPMDAEGIDDLCIRLNTELYELGEKAGN